ncbi:hypothetical protein ACQ9BO_22470 [Flavobacterium sp. P21]|uniref:hypothetical protein n=1 Tax=Flavobacterium sp. P21 TaxID=3423948 RepID=UPI003D67E2FE
MKKNVLQIIASFIVVLLFSCQRTTSSYDEIAVAVDSAAVIVDSTTPTIANKWEYHESTDKMTSKSIKFAQIISNESLNLEFPYDGNNYGRLILRKKTAWTYI